MKHDFRYFFREGIRNMFSHGFMSFAAIGVTVACLVIMGTFSLVAYNANENLKDLQKENAVLAFVDENLSDNEAKALQSTLEKIPGVGEKRRRALLQRFGSLRSVRAASLGELESVLPRPTARAVYEYFHKENEPCE